MFVEMLESQDGRDSYDRSSSDSSQLRSQFEPFFESVAEGYRDALAEIDSSQSWRIDTWAKEEGPVIHSGSGKTGIFMNGDIFEQAVVATSVVEGELPESAVRRLFGIDGVKPFKAAGVSLIVHPRSPLVPTTHANIRMLSVGDAHWFGGGADLTPYYVFEEDCVHFHTQLRDACEGVRSGWYATFKKWCDEYFYLPHRNEARGIGGIFYDYIGRDSAADLADGALLTERVGKALTSCYVPIVLRRKDLSWTDEQKEFQLLRRGRYVEFNLLYDRGTQFGIQTGGRAESILSSLPPVVHWQYDWKPTVGSQEASLLELLGAPRDWI